MEFLVNLNMVEDVKKFVDIAGKQDFDILIKNQGRAIVIDAKSIMGVFSLDLSNPVIVVVYDETLGKGFKDAVKEFVVE